MRRPRLATFYWAPSTRRSMRSRLRGKKSAWSVGNAGDLFNVDLIQWAYPNVRVTNAAEGEGPKLLLIGSIARLVGPGDVVCGIGAKSPDLAPAPSDVHVRGVRGPLSLDAFSRVGYDVADVEFLADPGLLIGRVFPELAEVEPERGRTIVVPHYRQRTDFAGSPIPVVHIDSRPADIGHEIARSEHVYTSSLHGLIWAHALGRPATLISPPNEEPAFKYEDYLLSVGCALGSIPSLEEALRSRKPDSPVDVAQATASISLPTLDELRARGVVG